MGVVVRLKQVAPWATFQALMSVCFSTPGKGARATGIALPRGVHGVPKAPRRGAWASTNGLHLVIILQRKLGREGELWVSAVAKRLRKGLLEFDTFTRKLFCSGSPQVTVGAWMFPVRETAGITSVCLSICGPSTSPPTHSSSVCEHVLGLSPHVDQTDLSSRMSGWEGQLYYNR